MKRNYSPPSGSAGGESKGMFESKSNPRSIPEKGSQIPKSFIFGMNGDKSKVVSMQKAQMAKESLRGQGC